MVLALNLRRAFRRLSVAAMIAAALTSCGTQQTMFTGQGPTYDPSGTYDCCVERIYYICQNKLAYGQCLGTPPDPSSCTIQESRDCPATSNQ